MQGPGSARRSASEVVRDEGHDLRPHEDVLGFRLEDAVRWLSPGELWRAGVKVVLSSVFASYADKREVQEALQPTPLAVRQPASGELWLDFVA